MNEQHVVSVRFTPEQAALLAERAAERGIPVSTYIKHQVLLAELKARPGTRVSRLANGAELTWWSATPEVFA